MLIPLLWMMAAPALAAPFGEVPVQGFLSSIAGVPSDGTFSMELVLYTTSPSSPLWQDTVAVPVDRGVFRVMLGAATPLDLAVFDGRPDAMLQITIDGDTLEPIPVGDVPAVAFAAMAGDAETLDGLVPGDLLDASYLPDWSEVASVPAGLDDGDDDTIYAAGRGLELGAGNTLAVDEVVAASDAAGVVYDTEAELMALLDDDYKDAAWLPGWSEVSLVPVDWADGDADTTYGVGTGLGLSGTTIDLDASAVEATARAATLDTEGELTALLDDDYKPSSYAPGWGEVTARPPAWTDGDDDTTYAAGTGMSLSGTSLSLDAATLASTARGATYDTEAELRALLDDNYLPITHTSGWSEVTNVPADWADGDANTTYSAGSGLSLASTTVSMASGHAESVSRDATYDTKAELTGALDSEYTTAMIGRSVAPWRALLSRSGNILNLNSPDGVVDSLDTTGMVPGELRLGPNQRIALSLGNSGGLTDSTMYIVLQGAPGYACLRFANEDDVPLPGYYFGTDAGNGHTGIWGSSRLTFIFRREADFGLVIRNNSAHYITCF